MGNKIGYVALLVKDYDEAIEYFVYKLDFELIEDTQINDNNVSKRWVLVSPKNSTGTNILLAKPSNEDQEKCIGTQTGGRVFMFLHTDNFNFDYEQMKNKGVKFLEEPRIEKYGTVVKFEDLYGNKWDLLELKK